MAVAHETLAALVRPRHDVANGVRALAKTVQQADKFDLEQLHEVLVPAVAHERGLVADRLEVDGLPGAAHVCELLLVREDG